MVGSSITVDLSSIETTLATLGTDISEAQQAQIDAAARIAYGDDYKGVWAAGTFAVGNVVFHSGDFYECDSARTSANTQNPTVNTSAWSIIQSLRRGQAVAGQDTIDAQARAIFGTDYRGTWGVGEFAVADVVYWVGKFYECSVRRDNTDTSNPATDTSSWGLTERTRKRSLNRRPGSPLEIPTLDLGSCGSCGWGYRLLLGEVLRVQNCKDGQPNRCPNYQHECLGSQIFA